MTAKEIRDLLDKDPWYQKLLKKLEAKKNKRLPSPKERNLAWERVVTAYMQWSNLDYAEINHEADMTKLLADMRRRRQQLILKAQRLVIHRIRKRLGWKFQRLPEDMVTVRRQLPKLRKPQKETSSTPSN